MMFKKAVPLLLSALLLSGCAPPATTASVFLKQVPLNSSAKEVAIPSDIRDSMYALSTELTADHFKTSEKKNQIFSPLSLWYALGVLREGAVGETRAEIEGIMKLPQGFDSAQVIPDLSKALNFLTDSKIAKVPTKNGIMLTNGIFFDQRFAKNILESFWDKAGTVWGTESAQVDFTKEAATKEIIRKWVSEKTETFIDDYKATFATDGSAILNIYNVLYLKDLWPEPFTKLENQIFHAKGGDVTAPFMGKLAAGIPYADHAKARAVSFAGETGLNVWFMVPKSGQPVDLVPDLRDIMTAAKPATVSFQAPTLDIDGENLSIKKVLQSKGYERLFMDAQLDNMLKGVSAVVDDIKQKTKLQLDENGFKAAAVTEIGIRETSAPADPIEFTVDQPFLMVIEYQDLPLFIAQITDPAEK